MARLSMRAVTVDRYLRQVRRTAAEAKSRFRAAALAFLCFSSTMVQVNTPTLQMRPSDTPRNALLRSAKSVVGAPRSSCPPQQMAQPQFNGSAFGDSRRPSAHTITSLKRWSVAGKDLPGIIPLCPISLSRCTNQWIVRCLADKDDPRLRFR